MQFPDYYRRNPGRIPGYYVRNWDRLPEYIQRFWIRRADLAVGREKDAQAVKDRQKAERERERKLRRPPAKVWRIGDTLFWDPPETIDQLRIEGYWVSEKRPGGGVWSAHGDFVRPDTRNVQLFNAASLARVETKYHQQALGEVYYSAVTDGLGPDGKPDAHPYLVSRVRYYVTEKMFVRPEGAKRWRRVLAGFGVTKAKWVRGRRVAPLDPAMTADEAQSYADRGWTRWIPVARALRHVEKIRG